MPNLNTLLYEGKAKKMKDGKFKGFMLVSDMDGTLLNSKFEVSEENIKAIEYFVDNGGFFTIATGRMEFAVKSYLESVLVNAPTVLYNGALIYDFKTGEALWNRPLEGNISGVLKDLLHAFPYLGIEVFHGGNVYFLRENEETGKHRVKEGFTPIIASVEEIPEPWYKVILTTRPNRLPEVRQFLDGRDTTFRMVYSEPQFLELLNKRASKGEALCELTKMLGISMDHVISIGDNHNDIEMIKVSGTGFAVGNAHPDLKSCADHSCVHHDHHAAAYVVSWLERNLARYE